jgi:non-specific serine/threonine protein kinase
VSRRAGLAAARDAAVKLTTADGKLVGHGLLLNLPSRGPVVLTCHHVLAKSGLDRVLVAPGASGRPPVQGVFVEKESRPERDVAVLEIPADTPTGPNPLLHVPDWRHYALRLEGIGLSLGSETETFRAWLQEASSSVSLTVPYGPERYELRGAFALGGPTNVNEGISGSPLLCETGIVGLIHFARKETAGQERLGYLNPITAWGDGLPELRDLVEPFVSDALRRRAGVFRSPATSERGGLHIDGYTPVYVERDIDAEAQRTLEEQGLLCVIGRHNSGKSRLVKQLLDRHEDAVVVVPRPMEPPPELGDDSVFKDHDVFLLFDNLHVAVQSQRPLDWYLAFETVARRTVLILTSRNKDDWLRVKQEQGQLLEYLTVPEVYLGKTDGTDLSDDEGWALAERLELSFTREEFHARFDGTPGSLLTEVDRPPEADHDAVPRRSGAAIEIRDADAAEVAGDGPHNLAHVSSAFVGREPEIASIGDEIATCRLVTVTGGAGTGKTRLALEVAARFADRYPDGVWWVDLEAVTDPDVVQSTVALTVEQPSLALPAGETRLVEFLRDRRALVILDGLDGSRAAVTALCARVTAGAPAVRVLATAREPVALPWERVIELAPLSDGSTTEESPAIQLYRHRVGEGGAEAELSADDRSQVGSLWRELGGNTAAFEIAAAQAGRSGLRHVAGQLESLSGSGGSDGTDGVEIAVSCTLEQLPGDEKAVFARLSAFPSWFTLAAARDVVSGPDIAADAVPDLLGELVDHALVLIDERDPDTQRYRLIAAVRDVAAEHLRRREETEQTLRRHAEHYLALAEQGVERIYGRAAALWIERLIRERTNFRAALRWTVRVGEPELGWRLGAALWPLLLMRSRFDEGRRWLGELIGLAPEGSAEDLPDSQAASLAEVITGAAYLAYHQADYEPAEYFAQRALTIRERLGADLRVADNLNIVAIVARRRCEFATAHAKLEQAMAISRGHRDYPRLADQLNTLANTIREEGGDLDEAEDLQLESFGLFTRIGSERGCAMAQCDLAYILADEGLLDDARTHLERSLAVRTRLGDAQGRGQSLTGLGRIERRLGRPQVAIALHTEALALFEGMNDQLRVAETQEALAEARLHAGAVEEGLASLHEADAIRDATGAPRPPAMQTEIDAALEAGAVTHGPPATE